MLKSFSLKNKVALVTGAAGLLGQEFTLALAQAGAHVIALDIDEKGLEVFKDSEFSIETKVLDITQARDVSEVTAQLVEKHSHLNILVNSAAIDPKFDPQHPQEKKQGCFETLKLEDWNLAMDVSLTGSFLMCQSVAPHMLKLGGGSVVNIGSIYGMTGPDQRLYRRLGSFKPAHYSVSKAGLHGLTKYLAAYYAQSKVRVNTLTPGGVCHQHSDSFVEDYSKKTIMGRMADKKDMNGGLVYLCSEAASYVTGSNLIIDGGWTSW